MIKYIKTNYIYVIYLKMTENKLSKYTNIDKTVTTLLNEYKNNSKTVKEVSIELEKMYKNEFTSFGTKRVYARYGITRSGKILIDFKKNGRPISLSINECEKLNNILSSRNFENYIKSKRDLINERNQEYFDNLNRQNADQGESQPEESNDGADQGESQPEESNDGADQGESQPEESNDGAEAEQSDSKPEESNTEAEADQN